MVYKTPGEIELMDEANRIVHRVLDGIGERIKPGVSTRELDAFAEATIREAALAAEPVQRHLEGREPRKVIVVPGRLVNVVG